MKQGLFNNCRPTQHALDWRVRAAFLGSSLGSSQFCQNSVLLSLPPASNANRWAAAIPIPRPLCAEGRDTISALSLRKYIAHAGLSQTTWEL
jgi:hypothetical protein